MTEKQIYLKAAELVDRGKTIYSCWAILEAMGTLSSFLVDDHPLELKKYIKVFNGKRSFDRFSRRVYKAGQMMPYKNGRILQFRVLMLLFMAEACNDL